MTLSLLVGIEPPKEVFANTLKIQRFAATRLKDTIYAPKPHITVFVNSFSSFGEVENKIIGFIRKTKPFALKIEGLYTFQNDPLFKGADTIVYKLEKSAPLTKFQKEIAGALVPLRTDDQEKAILGMGSKFSPEQTENIKKHGLPYNSEKWIFHSSVVSVPRDKHKEI